MILASTILKQTLVTYKDQLIPTIKRRCETSPNPANHHKMLALLGEEDYDGCIELLDSRVYDEQFKSVILCTRQYSDITHEGVTELLTIWEVFTGEY